MISDGNSAAKTQNIQRTPKTATTNQNNMIINIYAFRDTRRLRQFTNLEMPFANPISKESHYSALLGAINNKLLAHLIAYYCICAFVNHLNAVLHGKENIKSAPCNFRLPFLTLTHCQTGYL